MGECFFVEISKITQGNFFAKKGDRRGVFDKSRKVLGYFSDGDSVICVLMIILRSLICVILMVILQGLICFVMVILIY